MTQRRTKIGFDMSAFIWNSLLTGKDTENGFKAIHKEKEVWINSRYHGYDICLQRILDVLDHYKLTPVDMVMAFEGENSKAKRLMIDAGYKQGREHPAESYAEFIAVRDEIKKDFLERGAQALTQARAEGDDTLAWLAVNTEDDLIIATFDNDLAALNTSTLPGGVNAYGATVTVWINGQDGGNKYGMFAHYLITTYKALVGDSSDGIKGCPGFGPVKFDMLIKQYGEDGLAELHQMLSKSNLSDIAGCDKATDPLLVMISDNAPQVIKCFDLAKLRPQWVDTKMDPIKWEAGMVRQYDETADKHGDPRMNRWLGRARLVGADNFEQACEWAMPHILASRDIALDIETSTPDESSEWLERQGDIDGVDVFGSYLVGLGLTFGRNNQYTLYFNVKHADRENNIDSELLRQFIAKIPQDKRLIIQNVSFELAVLFNEWGERQLDNGFHGFLPNVLDTKFEANYVDENSRTGLKERSKSVLGYTQQTYDETTLLTAAPADLPPGGRWVKEAYLTHTVGTGKFEQIVAPECREPEDLSGTDEPFTSGEIRYIDGPEIMEQQYVLVGTGRFEPKEIIKRGKVVGTEEVEIMERVVATETRRYKMHELTGAQVFGYGADDPICTIALHNYYRWRMQLEHQYMVYQKVEIKAAYLHAKSFLQGVPFSVETMNKLVEHDDKVFDDAWAVLRAFLIKNGWEGTQPPTYGIDITAAQAKEAFEIATGRKMDTAMRTISKLAVHASEIEGEPIFGALLARLDETKSADGPVAAAAAKAFTDYVLQFFKGEPTFNSGSPKQKENLMYKVMGLTVQVRNPATDQMKAAGQYEGNPKTDVLAIAYALRECDEKIAQYGAFMSDIDEQQVALWKERKATLEAMKLMAMVQTRRSLFYSKYPPFMHWKDGRIRSSHNQSSTNTRRASESGPNKQQLPKHAKVEGQESKFRSAIVPHHPKAVVVSIDFDQQELRNIAEQSGCPELLACFVGDNPRKMHGITGVGIAQDLRPDVQWDYDKLMAIREDKSHELNAVAKEAYNLGKKVNFTSEYGAMAPKVAATLLITEDKAQAFLDFREESFPGVVTWKEDIVVEAKANGIVRTMNGAVRHLREALASKDRYEASKAERQAINFKVQSSCAEQTKEAEGRLWDDNLFYEFDAVYFGPIHDELVASVMIEDLVAFLPRMHAAMVANYGGMKSVPIVASISFGPDFYYQTEIGNHATPEAIAKGLEDMYAAIEKRAAQAA